MRRLSYERMMAECEVSGKLLGVLFMMVRKWIGFVKLQFVRNREVNPVLFIVVVARVA